MGKSFFFWKMKAKADGSPRSNQARTMLQSFPSAFPFHLLFFYHKLHSPPRFSHRAIHPRGGEWLPPISRKHTQFPSTYTQLSALEKLSPCFRRMKYEKNTFFHPFVERHTHTAALEWHRTNFLHRLTPQSSVTSKSHENAKHYQRKEFSKPPPINIFPSLFGQLSLMEAGDGM